MEYLVTIDAFQGPLDLLLYLIKEARIDIDNVNVSEITQQYLDYLHAMEDLNLEIASEYLRLAAYLIYIKSRKMLPQSNLDDENISYEENPEEQLKRRLKLYSIFKDVVSFFQEQETERENYLTKIPSDLSEELKIETKDFLLQDVDIYDLLSAYNRVLKRYSLHKPIKTKIKPQTITIDERIQELSDLFRTRKKLRFTEIFEENVTKELIVVTFMAILELTKHHVIRLHQDTLFQDIYIEYLDEEMREAHG
ncbi:MAG: segregation/condensation protein A [Bacilli bacterium]|nr:segregation/condensation protein A [Bacilli bacterium]